MTTPEHAREHAGPPAELELSANGHELEAADALAAVAARAAAAPAASIHLVDGDRLRLIGGLGLPPGFHVQQRVPAGDTMAGVVVREKAPMIVTDVATDARVPSHAPAREGGIRSYAGFTILDPDGTVVGVCAVMDYRARDWTPEQLAGVADAARACTAFVAQRAAATAADATRRFLDALLDTLPVGVIAVDADARVAFTNRAIRRMIDAPPVDADLPGWARQAPISAPDGRPQPVDELPLLRALRGDSVHDAEMRYARPGERARLLNAAALPITDENDTCRGAVLAAQDVTDLRRAQRFSACELAAARALTDAEDFADAGPRVLGVICGCLGWQRAELWVRDEQADVLRPVAAYQDPGHRGHVAMPESRPRGEGLVGKTWQSDAPVWIRKTDTDPATQRAAVAGLPTAVAVPVPTAGHVQAVLALFADVLEDPEDVLVGLLQGVAAQIGEYLVRRRAHELQMALARSTDEYLALISHEIRTPLTAINAYAELLLDPADDLSPDAAQMVDVVRRQSGQVLHIIDELLDLAALESGHAPIVHERCDLVELVREATAGLRDVAEGAGLTIRTRLPEQCPACGDPHRLRQVIDTLVGNAIAYSPDGGHITITATARDSVAELNITDPGIGIPAGEREQLFSRFYRSSRTRERRIPGAGLALAVTRAIVQRHDGSIRLLSDGSPGTHIQVRLPVECRSVPV